MSDEPSPAERQLAIRIAATANAEEKEALRSWIERLLAIRESQAPALAKGRLALSVTLDSQVIWPTVKLIAREVKRLAWDERSLKGRLGIGGVLVGLTVFSGQGAGIAALGTAIGVPLWVVFGAGAVFAGDLYERITGKKANGKTTYVVIDAEREERK